MRVGQIIILLEKKHFVVMKNDLLLLKAPAV
jgi:hypothetical protein